MSERTVLVRLRLAIQEYVRDAKLAERAGTSAMDKTRIAAAGAGREVRVLERNTDMLGRTSLSASRDVDKFGVSLVRADKNIDRMSGRLKIIVQSLTAVSPALVPLTTGLVPILTTVATGLGFVAGAVGAGALALNGVGDALEAIEKARLEPTAENLMAMQVAMEQLGPDGAAFAKAIDQARPALRELQMSSRAGLLPGLGDALDTILDRGPQAGDILYNLGDATGDLARQAADALTSGDFDEFFDFLEREARPQLMKLGTTLGYVAKAGTETFMALDPLTDSFGDGLLNGAEKLAEAATRMNESDGARDFIAYVQETGPEVVETFLAIGNGLIKVGEAAAPLSGPVLDSIEGVADAIAAIADSPVGTPLVTLAVGAAALSRAVAVVTALRAALVGSALANPLVALGVAAGGAVVAMDKLGRSQSDYAIDGQALTDTLNQQTGAITQNTRAFIAKELIDQGVFDSAQRLGVGLDVVTDAAMGNESSMRQMNAAIAASSEAFYDSEGRVIVGAEALAKYREDMYIVGDAVGQTSGALKDGQSDVRQFAEAMGETENKLTSAEMATRDFQAALTSLDAFLSGRASFRNYQAALDDFTAGLKENGKSFSVFNEKGRANLANLDKIASSAAEFAETLKPKRRANFIANAVEDLEAVKAQTPEAAGQIDKLIARLEKAGKTNVKPKVEVNAAPARSQLEAIQRELNNLDGKTVKTFVDTYYRKRGVGADVEVATGGHIRGPGTGTSDSIPARLSNGEFVVKASATQNNLGLLHQINTFGASQRFANGGRVGGAVVGPVDARGADRSVDRLGKAAEKSAKELAKEARQREKSRLQGIRDATRSAVTDSFRSDLFTPDSSNMWAKSASADPMARLRADIANAKRFDKARAQLEKKGLDGTALDLILSRGDPNLAEEYAAKSSTELDSYERLVNARERLTAGVGARAGDAVAGEQLAALKRLEDRMARVEDAVRDGSRITGERVGAVINSTAKNGNKRSHR